MGSDPGPERGAGVGSCACASANTIAPHWVSLMQRARQSSAEGLTNVRGFDLFEYVIRVLFMSSGLRVEAPPAYTTPVVMPIAHLLLRKI